MFVIAADQVDVHLLRCQQLRLYILKAARALLSHQDKLRQILSQPAVIDVSPSPTGETRMSPLISLLVGFTYLLLSLSLCSNLSMLWCQKLYSFLTAHTPSRKCRSDEEWLYLLTVYSALGMTESCSVVSHHYPLVVTCRFFMLLLLFWWLLLNNGVFSDNFVVLMLWFCVFVFRGSVCVVSWCGRFVSWGSSASPHPAPAAAVSIHSTIPHQSHIPPPGVGGHFKTNIICLW